MDEIKKKCLKEEQLNFSFNTRKPVILISVLID